MKEAIMRLKAKTLNVKGKDIAFTEKRRRPTVVSVLYYPVAGSNKDLVKTLETYGEVLAMKEMVYKQAPGVKTGTRLFRMVMKEHIPKHIMVNGDGSSVEVIYTGQPVSCNICHRIGHMAEKCDQAKCSKCLAKGHLARNCTNEVKCRNCSGLGHVSKDWKEPCGNCGQEDHISDRCRSKPTWQQKSTEVEEEQEEKEDGEIEEGDGEGEDLSRPLVMDDGKSQPLSQSQSQSQPNEESGPSTQPNDTVTQQQGAWRYQHPIYGTQVQIGPIDNKGALPMSPTKSKKEEKKMKKLLGFK
jgi:hypothetical protein